MSARLHFCGLAPSGVLLQSVREPAGSVATGKYVDILLPVFGQRLRFPVSFAGLGDMSRGGLMLRAAVRTNRELEYVPLSAPRHARPAEVARCRR